MSNRSATVRRRSGGAPLADHPRAPDRRRGRGGGGGSAGLAAGRPRRGGLVGRCLRRMPLLPFRSRKPLPRGSVHGLGSRWRLRGAHHSPGRLRAPAAAGVRRPGGGASPLWRHHRLPCAAPLRHRAGWPPWPLRLRRLRFLGHPSGALLGLRGLRRHPIRGGTGARAPWERSGRVAPMRALQSTWTRPSPSRRWAPWWSRR